MPIDPITIPPGGGDGTFPDTALGAIIWPKALGRPNKPHLADGFSILMHGTDVQATGQGGQVLEIGYVLEPRVQEADGGSDHWRIEFFQGNLKSVEGLTRAAPGPIDSIERGRIERQATYKVTIDLRPGVAWSGPRPVRAHPHERAFLKHEGTLQLPDFRLAAD
jgi:hypothetical protein